MNLELTQDEAPLLKRLLAERAERIERNLMIPGSVPCDAHSTFAGQREVYLAIIKKIRTAEDKRDRAAYSC